MHILVNPHYTYTGITPHQGQQLSTLNYFSNNHQNVQNNTKLWDTEYNIHFWLCLKTNPISTIVAPCNTTIPMQHWVPHHPPQTTWTLPHIKHVHCRYNVHFKHIPNMYKSYNCVGHLVHFFRTFTQHWHFHSYITIIYMPNCPPPSIPNMVSELLLIRNKTKQSM